MLILLTRKTLDILTHKGKKSISLHSTHRITHSGQTYNTTFHEKYSICKLHLLHIYSPL